MNLTQKILALLKSAFPGVREDGLLQLAGALALQVETEEEATNIVGKYTAEKVEQFVKDWRKQADSEIAKANTTYETSLKEKYDFVEKGKPADPKPVEPTQEVTFEQVQKLLDEKFNGIAQVVNSFNAEKLTESRRAAFVGELDAAKLTGTTRDLLLDNFQRMNFKDDADFTDFMAKQKENIAKLAQEDVNRNLQNQGAPTFGAVTKEGISQGVAAYIAQKQQQEPALTGKEI